MSGRPCSARAALALTLGLTLTAASLATACGPPALLTARDDVYEQGVAALGEDDPVLALRAVWHYLKGAGVDDPRNDRALKLMARAAEALHLRYAASIWYLTIAQGGRDPELLPDAVEGLERVILGGPHDEELLITGFLAAEDLSSLPTALQAFVDYYAGLDSQRRGDLAWADQRFDRLPKASPYRWRARYVRGVRQVATGALDDAQAAFEAILAEADDPNRVGVSELPADLRNDVDRSLARLHFEAGRWDRALFYYDRLRERTPSDATLSLEMAWAHFYEGDTRRALGLALALDAPEFAAVIAPERYLLEAICLRRLCQFEPAREAAVRLEQRYADAYRELESGASLTADPALVAAAAKHPAVRATTALEASLEAERRAIAALADELEPELVRGLDEIYARGLDEVGRKKRGLLREAVVQVANALLAARENVRFVTHELSVALLRGRLRPEGPRERDPVRLGATEGRVLYRFDGEFWSDELDDLLVMVEDRCIE